MKSNYIKETRKQIAFDIDTNELEKYYPAKNWRYTYEVIKTFMMQRGFEHIQGSVYVSKKPMTYYKIITISKKLFNSYPYLHKAMRDIVVTEVGEIFNLNFLLNKDYPIVSKED